MTRPHVESFASVSPLPAGANDEEIEATLSSLCARGLALLPDLRVTPEELCTLFAARASMRDAVLSRADVADDALIEFAIVAGAVRRDERALRELDTRFIAPLDRVLSHMKLSVDRLDDVKQRVREKLLMPRDDGTLPLSDYAGDGRLGGLVRVAATRAALDMMRRDRATDAGEEELLTLPTSTQNPALAALAARCRTEFRAAFEQAAASLDQRERNLLRLHTLSGVTLEPLASMYGVHRATVVRWLADARQKLMVATRKKLEVTLQVNAQELDSLLGLVESRLDVSISRLFNESGGP